MGTLHENGYKLNKTTYPKERSAAAAASWPTAADSLLITRKMTRFPIGHDRTEKVFDIMETHARGIVAATADEAASAALRYSLLSATLSPN